MILPEFQAKENPQRKALSEKALTEMPAQNPIKKKGQRKDKEKSCGHQHRWMTKTSVYFYNSLPK
ncbi:hypothetical protein EBX31_13795 [bacterium]|nr:hypothetical protein [bacterium]